MDLVELHQLAIDVAEQVAPDEAPLAPLWLDAYLEGGQRRAALFDDSSASGTAGFGVSDAIAVLPRVFEALAVAAPALLLALETAANAAQIAALAQTWRPSPRPSSPQLAEVEAGLAVQALGQLHHSMCALGLESEQAEKLTGPIVVALVEKSPEVSVELLRTLSEAR